MKCETASNEKTKLCWWIGTKELEKCNIRLEKEAKKEAFRKYLESSGVLDALTKVLVALYEENDKPSSAVEFVQNKLGGPTLSEYERLQAEKSDLQMRYDELLAAHQEACRELDDLRNSTMLMEAACEGIPIDRETPKHN